MPPGPERGRTGRTRGNGGVNVSVLLGKRKKGAGDALLRVSPAPCGSLRSGLFGCPFLILGCGDILPAGRGGSVPGGFGFGQSLFDQAQHEVPAESASCSAATLVGEVVLDPLEQFLRDLEGQVKAITNTTKK